MLVFVNRSEAVVEWLVDVSPVCAGSLREILGLETTVHFPDEKGLLTITLPPLSARVMKATVHPLFAARQSGILLHPTSLPDLSASAISSGGAFLCRLADGGGADALADSAADAGRFHRLSYQKAPRRSPGIRC